MMTPETYWRLKAHALALERDEAQLRLALAARAEAFHAALRAAGIDPSIPATWDDATATIRPRESVPCPPDPTP